VFTLQSIPKGDWFCYDCRPYEPEPVKSQTRKKMLSDDEIAEELDSHDENESDAETSNFRKRTHSGSIEVAKNYNNSMLSSSFLRDDVDIVCK